MSQQVSLTARQLQILRATICHYIATAEPVGSKALATEYGLSVSPATIRSCMGFLEKAGLLYQPHTSAGRVPSDSGYRIYVDQLITPSEALGRQVEHLLTDREDSSFEKLLRDAAQILAGVSGYISLITLPQTRTTRLRHLQLVQLEPGRVMLIVVTDAYETQSVLMELPQSTDELIVERELQMLSNFLNSKLKERSLGELAGLDWSELDREFAGYAVFLQTVMTELTRRTLAPVSTPIMIRGISEVLRQPEFSELQQVQMLLHLLEEEQEQLWPVIFELPSLASKSRVRVRIGSENPLEPMRTCALVCATYQQGEVPVGSVGILGPTRMLYENAIALVETAANYLTDALTQPA